MQAQSSGRRAGRAFDALRSLTLEIGPSAHAEGSCLITAGRTQVYCTASVEERVPAFLRGQGKGWVTAEYGMLPRATHMRSNREAISGKQGGRTLEIQRLIGRSLRAVTTLKLLGEITIKLDCDVLQADGGTRTAAITGSYVALHMAVTELERSGKISTCPLTDTLTAVSCGIVDGTPLLDLDYEEDSQADVDANFVMTGTGQLVEIQASAEGSLFSRDNMTALLDLAFKGQEELRSAQEKALARHALSLSRK